MQIPLLKTYPLLIVSCNKRYLVLKIFVPFFLLFYAAQIRYTYNVHLLLGSAWLRWRASVHFTSSILFFLFFKGFCQNVYAIWQSEKKKKGNFLVCICVLWVNPANMRTLILFRHQKTKDASPSSSSSWQRRN